MDRTSISGLRSTWCKHVIYWAEFNIECVGRMASMRSSNPNTLIVLGSYELIMAEQIQTKSMVYFWVYFSELLSLRTGSNKIKIEAAENFSRNDKVLLIKNITSTPKCLSIVHIREMIHIHSFSTSEVWGNESHKKPLAMTKILY